MSAYIKITNKYTPKEKQLFWDLSVGLQAVDSLKPSDYLRSLIDQEVRGELTLKEVKEKLNKYYEFRKEEADLCEKEADIASVRIN